MIVNARFGFVFVHIPKTAGSSVAAALATLPGRRRAWESRSTKHETYEEFLTGLASRPGPAAKAANFRVFAFIRNPWDRFVSLHRYLLLKQTARYPMVPPEVNAFARLLRDPPSWCAPIRSLRPQLDFIPAWRRGLLLGRFETLEADFDRMRQVIGVDLALPHLNASTESGQDNRRCLDPEAVVLVGRHFAADVRAFNYSFE